MGKFLRATSLDELPQIWNVLRGEMSLVGPRPVVREELLRYGRSAGVYLAVKPGVTGLWQATGRNDTDYRRRVAMDIYYVKNQSLFLDVVHPDPHDRRRGRRARRLLTGGRSARASMLPRVRQVSSEPHFSAEAPVLEPRSAGTDRKTAAVFVAHL